MDASKSHGKSIDEGKGKSKTTVEDPPPPVVDVDVDEEVASSKGGGRNRSWVWDHFSKKKGETMVKCPYCPTKMCANSRKNGTSAMSNHLRFVCIKSPVYRAKDNDTTKQSVLSFKKSAESGATSLQAHSFNQEKCRKSLANMCIKDNYPFSVVDGEGMRELFWDLQPLFRIPSRWTVARDCLKIYKEEGDKLKNILKDQTISITTDTWTSAQNINYMCLTGHWVDDEWKLRKKILNFCPIANHKGATIGRLVYACLQNWGIDKVFTVTVDNASSNDGAIKYLTTMLRGPNAFLDCKYLHLRCCAHIINLVVRDGLEEHFDSITRIRNAVKYVRSSPARAATFKSCVEKVDIKCSKKPELDVDTRWNSTFLMLETAEKYETAFDRLVSTDTAFKLFCGTDDDDGETSTRKRKRSERVVGAPDTDDWEVARYFIDYLRIFYNVTKKISGSKYVTANMFFGELVTMQASITQMCLSTDEKKKRMALSMKEKYDKYWDNIDNMNFLLHVAVILDPRNKLCYLEYCLEMIYGNNSEKTKEILVRVKKTLEDLFDHFKKKSEREKAQQTKGKSSSTHVPSYFDSGVNMEDDFARFLEERGKGVHTTELEVYLGDGMEKRVETFEILNWWKLNSLKFPILSQVAQHVLGMPISTVASESAFSTGGRVIDPHRSSLTTITAEALICTQDWVRRTPVDIQFQSATAVSMEELRQKLEKIELDEFGTRETESINVDIEED